MTQHVLFDKVKEFGETRKREETDTDGFKQHVFREHYKKYKFVLQELDDILWSPCPNTSKMLIFGMCYRESVNEITNFCDSSNVPFLDISP